MNYYQHKELKNLKEKIISWLLKLKEDEFINVFKFQNSNFIILIWKIGLRIQKTHQYYLKLKDDKDYNLLKDDYKNIDLDSNFEFSKNKYNNYFNMKLIKLYTKKFRFLSIDEIFDTVTFSKNCLNGRLEFIKNMDNMLNGHLFLRSDNHMNNKDNQIRFSNWFNFKTFNHFTIIIIAHIEYSIIESFKNYQSNKLNSTILLKNDLLKFYGDLPISIKNDLIENSIYKFENYSLIKNLKKNNENCFKEKNFWKNLKREEYIFYLIFYEKFLDLGEKLNNLVMLGNNFRKYFDLYNINKYNKKILSTTLTPNFSQIIEMISVLHFIFQNNLILNYNLKNLDDLNSIKSWNNKKKKKKKKNKKKKKKNKDEEEKKKDDEDKEEQENPILNEIKKHKSIKKLKNSKSFLSENDNVNYYENKKYLKLKSRENSFNGIIHDNLKMISSENNSDIKQKNSQNNDFETNTEKNSDISSPKKSKENLQENKSIKKSKEKSKEKKLRLEYFKLSELNNVYNPQIDDISNDDEDYLNVEERPNKKQYENKYTNTSPSKKFKYKNKKNIKPKNSNPVNMSKNIYKKKKTEIKPVKEVIHKIKKCPNKPIINANPNPNNKNIFKKWNNDQLDIKSNKKAKINRENTEKYISFYFNKLLTSQIKSHLKNIIFRNSQLKIIKELAINRLLNVLYYTYDMNLNFKIYGSYKTNLITPFSDIDLSIVGLKTNSRSFIIDALSKYSSVLENLKFIKICNPILTANIPVVKLEIDLNVNFESVHELTKNKDYNLGNNHGFSKEDLILKIDITVENIDENNSSSGERTTDFILYCINNYNSFYDFILFMKIIMGNYNLNNPYKGGLNSFGLSIMYIAFLNIDKRFLNEELSNCILKFLSFYSSKFNPFEQGINLGYNLSNIKNPFFKIEGYSENLNIMDPTSNCNKNCTSTSYNIGIIFKAFKFWSDKSKKIMYSIKDKIDDTFNQNLIKKTIYDNYENIDLVKEIFGYKFE